MTDGISEAAISRITPMLDEIRELKKKHNAVVLSHYYMTPELQIDTANLIEIMAISPLNSPTILKKGVLKKL